MKCKICGYVFDENEKTATCQGCSIHNCNMVRCPNCGFEHLPERKTESKLYKILKNSLNLGKNKH